MNEELVVKAGLSLIDYGVLGIFCLLLIIVTVYLGRSAVSSKEVLQEMTKVQVEIKELLQAQVEQLKAQKERDSIYFGTIDFERNRTKECIGSLKTDMSDLKKDISTLTNELKLCQICKK